MSLMDAAIAELLGETALEAAVREARAREINTPAQAKAAAEEWKKAEQEKKNAAKGILTSEAMAKMLADGKAKAAADAKAKAEAAADYTAPFPTQEQAGFKPQQPTGLTPATPVVAQAGMSTGSKVAIAAGSVGVLGLIILLIVKLGGKK